MEQRNEQSPCVLISVSLVLLFLPQLVFDLSCLGTENRIHVNIYSEVIKPNLKLLYYREVNYKKRCNLLPALTAA